MESLGTAEMLALAGLAAVAAWAMLGAKKPVARAAAKSRPALDAVAAFNELRMHAAASKLEQAVIESPDNPHLAGFGGLFPKREGEAPKAG